MMIMIWSFHQEPIEMIKREKSEVGRDNSEDDDDADDDDDDNDYDDDDDVKEKTVKHQHRKNSCR